MNGLRKVLCSLLNKTVTVILEGAPAVTATVILVDRCSVTLLATSGSTVLIPFSRITAVEVYPAVFPPAPIIS
ncbi:Hypothetical protein LUCI_4419 [Lucifera butyrica]|uniref:Uncharacterized protein n=1 Tax=Lucifera butyrica TaxID=1351585 RepID=A0A498RGB1_9FIRM|nr:hypothetical protein [Lucifera butyrica]VBB09133.1 Hypothetical protein LUCI_4419 [Lucifera butyrica]